MSDKKISQLPAASDTDVGSSASYEIPVVVNGTTKKVSNSQVLAPVRQELQSTKSELTQLSSKLSGISSNNTSVAEKSISFQKDNGVEVVKVNDSGLSVTGSLKLNGENVMTSQDLSSKSDKIYVDGELAKKQNAVEQLSTTTTRNSTQEVSFTNDAQTAKYVSIGDYGIKAVSYLDINGNPIVDGVPIMNNPPLNLQKDELRILDIGNSFTEDPTFFLQDMAASAGIDTSKIAFCRAIRSSGTFKTWYNCYHDADNHTYWADRQFGSLSVSIARDGDSGSITCNANDGTLFRRLLTSNKWDIIIIHQVSSYSASFDKWTLTGDDGYLNELLRILRHHQPQASIMFSLVHSTMDNYSENPDGDSTVRWSHIAQAAKMMRSRYGMSIIPYGTAVENLRQTTLNNSYDLSSDGKHLAKGLAKYAGACAYFQTLFAPRFGVSVYGNSLRYTCTDSDRSGSTYPSSCVDVTNSNAPIAQMAALLACENQFQVINPQNITL